MYMNRSEYDNLVKAYPKNIDVKNNSEVQLIRKWFKTNTITSNSPLSEYGKNLSRLKEILKSVNSAIDITMRQEQLVIEINKRMEIYKNNNEICQYLNILSDRLQNINEVNQVQRDLTELENCYEKKQITLELVYIYIYIYLSVFYFYLIEMNSSIYMII